MATAIKKITSATNPRIKAIVRFRDRKIRSETGKTLIEGVREIQRAIDGGITIDEVYVCNGSTELIKSGNLQKSISKNNVPIYETARNVFKKITYGDREDGILALVTPRALKFNDLGRRPNPVYVVVEGVEKPGNLGAILRTCDGVGVDGCIVCDSATDLYNPNVIRASLGTVFTVKTVLGTNDEAIEFLKANHIKVCATMPAATSVYTESQLSGPIAVVVGSEQKGLSPFWAKHADLKVKIPMKGRADSLNVSATTAILLYEILRQRSK